MLSYRAILSLVLVGNEVRFDDRLHQTYELRFPSDDTGFVPVADLTILSLSFDNIL